MKRRKKAGPKASPQPIRVVGVKSDLWNFPSKDDPDFLWKMKEHLELHHDTIAGLKKLKNDVEKRQVYNAKRREDHRRSKGDTPSK